MTQEVVLILSNTTDTGTGPGGYQWYEYQGGGLFNVHSVRRDAQLAGGDVAQGGYDVAQDDDDILRWRCAPITTHDAAPGITPTTTPRDILLVFTNCRPGQDDAVNDWWEHEHLPDTLALDGFLSGQRYRVTTVDAPYRYLNVWEVEFEAARRSVEAERAERAEAEAAGRPPEIRIHPGLLTEERMGGRFTLVEPVVTPFA